MTEHRLHRFLANRHDYLPAAGRDIFLPGYDLVSRLFGMTKPKSVDGSGDLIGV